MLVGKRIAYVGDEKVKSYSHDELVCCQDVTLHSRYAHLNAVVVVVVVVVVVSMWAVVVSKY
jgi:hypothetical protein